MIHGTRPSSAPGSGGSDPRTRASPSQVNGGYSRAPGPRPAAGRVRAQPGRVTPASQHPVSDGQAGRPQQNQRLDPPLHDTDLPPATGSNRLPDFVSGTGITYFAECLVRLQAEAEAAADDLLHDLGGAAEDRLDVAEPPELPIVPKSSGLVLPPVKAGSVWSARAAAFAWRDLGGDHPPRDRLAAAQLPQPRRSPDDHAEPAAADIPAIGADLGSGELIAAQLPQVLGMHEASHGSQVRPCSREPPRGNQHLGRSQDAHPDSMGICGARWPLRRPDRHPQGG